MRTPQSKRKKPSKPKGSPLTAHPNGQWSKKHKGTPYYFGVWEDHDAAVERFNHEWPYIVQGKTPPPLEAENGFTLELLANTWLDARKKDVSEDRLSPRTWDEYRRVGQFVCDTLGKTRPPLSLTRGDFTRLHQDARKVWRGSRITNFVNYTKQMFRWGEDLDVIDHLPKFGRQFRALPKKDQREIRHKTGKLMFTPDECHKLLEAASIPMRAMILLGLNAGFGNIECSDLEQYEFDLDAGIVDTIRPKTKIWRRAALWPETVDAIRTAIAIRPKPNNPTDAKLVFVTKKGNRYVDPNSSDNAVAMEFGKLMRKTGIKTPDDPRKRLGFYSLRRTFRTHADEGLDDAIVDLIMGHANTSMGDTYVQERDDARLWKVAKYVRKKLTISGYSLVPQHNDDGMADAA